MVSMVNTKTFQRCKKLWGYTKGATIRFPGGGGGKSIFEINNFGRTLREINNLLQELFHINM